jgi:hypothetical protein
MVKEWSAGKNEYVLAQFISGPTQRLGNSYTYGVAVAGACRADRAILIEPY